MMVMEFLLLDMTCYCNSSIRMKQESSEFGSSSVLSTNYLDEVTKNF